MSGRRLWLETAAGRRALAPGELPLALGGAGADLPFAGLPAGVVAHVGSAEGDLFVQPADGAVGLLAVNGRSLAASQWLVAGDLLEAGEGRLRLLAEGEDLLLRLEARELPASARGPAAGAAGSGGDHNRAVAPVEYQPASLSASRGRRGPRPARVAGGLALLALVAAAWLLFSVRSVEVRVEPAPDELEITGALLHIEIGGRHLLRPGRYLVSAAKEGYRTLTAPLVVGPEPRQAHLFELEKLPGTLRLSTVPEVAGVEVQVDGEVVGAMPLPPLELTPGEHRVTVRADGWLEAGRSVTVAGGGAEQSLELALTRDGAPVTLTTLPANARVTLDGELLGTTPLTQGVASGRHVVDLELAGYRTRRLVLVVAPGEPLAPPPVLLEPAQGVLALSSEPPGASVTVDGVFRGETPLELALAPGGEHDVRLLLAGHEAAERRVVVAAEERRSLVVPLDPLYGEVEITGSPAGAEVLVDGEPAGRLGDTLRLTAVPHAIEVRARGRLPFRATVTPQPGVARALTVILESPEEAAAAATPPVVEGAEEHRLVLLPRGRFRMGAPRREPGRSSNEVEREVEITRPYYLAETVVTNRQFREFRPDHRSGSVGAVNLEIDHHPVVRVSWQDAAAYCNWLSERQGLPPAYVRRGSELVPGPAPQLGYRLPTEAEWAWAARYRGGAVREGLRYPWGDELPPPSGAGNFADAAGRAAVGAALPGYADGFAGTAPADAFPPRPPGLRGLGDNVAEWVQDRYGIPSGGGVERDPGGPQEGPYHVIRGAGWMDALVTELRLSHREYGDRPRPDVGFRVARTAGRERTDEGGAP